MQRIIDFILRNRNFLLYLLLFFISLVLTFQSHSYHRSKYFNSANWVSGTVYSTRDNITSYFKLKGENQQLIEENNRLRNIFYNLGMPDSVAIDTQQLSYSVVPARVIKNSYSGSENYLTLNKGAKDGLQQDMGVITAEGILGIVERTSNRFATVQSILNTKSNINAKIKNTDHFGSLTWNTSRFDEVQLEDIPRLVSLGEGDTIVTGAMSSIFPEGIPIGVVRELRLEDSASFYTIYVSLFNDMTNLSTVYVITDLNRSEILELENTLENEQD